ncbi:uncharacterized protein LOC115234334 [Formica exsecta]|uniref:uncharacterized protein LOC115234334 n=1 Tax=Formica exsecta TaxID=72781 RepID=UPI0011431B21|nr:uncharacterized protein LOC115234334 [Formica exsecta]XP_029661202.1 uncharacterized protein LOC115234334 [Formica exsecta]
MTSFTKIIFRLLPLGIVLLIAAVYHSLSDYKYIEVEESIINLQVSRHRRAINPKTVLRCKFNQYYDQEERRCLGVPGGGKVLHVENGQSCGVNILKPHCTSSLYYHICKRDKSILAQCANRQIFDSRLQRCAYYDSSKMTPSTIQPNNREYYEHVNVSFSVPNCTALGQFPVPDHCYMFYTCDTNGHTLHQSIFKCPRNTGYQPNRRVCTVMSDCENNDSVDSVCVQDAPGENVESLNSKETTEENVEETTEISEESETRNVNDSASKREESINSKTYDDIISTTPESVTSNTLSVNNYGDNNGDLYEASSLPTQPIQDISVSDGSGETSMLKQALNPTESAREVQNEKYDLVSPLNLQITLPPTVELDDNAHSIMTLMTSTPMYDTDINSNIDSETADTTPFSTISYTSSKLDERTQHITTEQYNNDETVTLPNSNTETLDPYSPSTISNISEFSLINDKSLNVDEEKRDVTGAIDSYQTSTISNVPESSSIVDTPSKLGEETQDTTMEEYRNNDDGAMTLPNSNTEAIDPYSTSTINNVPEFSPISETSSKLYEETQSTVTEQYGNDDRITTPANFNSEMVDQNPTPILSDISVTTDSPRNDFDTSTSASAILSPQADINDDQFSKELFKTSPSVDSKFVDPDLDVPEAIENVSTGYSFEHTDTLDLTLTTKSTLTLEHITASMDITTITPTIQNLPAISDTDLITQNGKDSTEALPFIEQDAALTNN